MKHLKRIFCILSTIIMLSSLLSCGSEKNFYPLGYSVLPYVSLYDYESISVDSDFAEASDADIKTFIEADLDSREIYKEITNRNYIENGDIIFCDISCDNADLTYNNYYYFTDSNDFSKDITDKLIGMKKGETLKFTTDEFIEAEMHIKGIYTFTSADDEEAVLSLYSCNSMEEAIEIVKEKIKINIIYNFALDEILKNSIIKKIPEKADIFVQNELNRINIDSDEATDEKEALYNIYFEYMIFAAIAEKENISFSEENFNQTVNLIAQSNGISASDVTANCEYEYIAYETIYEDVKNAITSHVTTTKK